MAATQDPWDCKVIESNEKEWSKKTDGEKVTTVLIMFLKITLVILILFLFIISLGLMGNAFKILGGKTAGQTFRENELFDNPIAGLVLGILATVLVQSSSTSTSIIITMTAAGLMEVKNAIPMIMGANIGTSVTNTIVSLAQVGRKDEYRRAFAGATVHDCFNLLTVGIMLPVEIIFGLLEAISAALVDASMEEDAEKGAKHDFLKKLTKPISSILVQVDKKLITKAAEAQDQDALEGVLGASMIVQSRTKDNHLFMDTPMSDAAAGTLLLIISLLFLTTCLAMLVKLLQSIFRGRVAIWMQSVLNLEFKSVPFVADYILMVFGAGITILMQSSSITTSTLTPLVGVGLIKLEKMFPFTVGANIGTTVTGILSALASSNIRVGMQVALAHLFFNLFGTVIWFPIPRVRNVPLAMARFLGLMAADLPWFPIAYILVMFGCVPAFLFTLSLAGIGACLVGVFLIVIVFGGSATLITFRLTKPSSLPVALRANPSWLPEALKAVEDKPAEEAVAEDAVGRTVTGNVDLGGARSWVFAPVAWGLGWFAICALATGVPNAQWANMKYVAFNTRDHVGIGAWSACGAQYKDAMAWASAPTCTQQQANDCFSNNMFTNGHASENCTSTGFADKSEVNEKYEASWDACRDAFGCSAAQWMDACLRNSCGGALHREQCMNVSEAVAFNYDVAYQPQAALAWNEGEKCRPLKDVCDNHEDIMHAGNMGVAGLIMASIGQTLLLAYTFKHQSKDLTKLLWVAAGAWAVAWLMLLISFASFKSALDAETSCTVVDIVTQKAVRATGLFKNIMTVPGFSYDFVWGCWIIVTLMAVPLWERIMWDSDNPWNVPETAAAAEPAVGEAQAQAKMANVETADV